MSYLASLSLSFPISKMGLAMSNHRVVVRIKGDNEYKGLGAQGGAYRWETLRLLLHMRSELPSLSEQIRI